MTIIVLLVLCYTESLSVINNSNPVFRVEHGAIDEELFKGKKLGDFMYLPYLRFHEWNHKSGLNTEKFFKYFAVDFYVKVKQGKVGFNQN